MEGSANMLSRKSFLAYSTRIRERAEACETDRLKSTFHKNDKTVQCNQIFKLKTLTSQWILYFKIFNDKIKIKKNSTIIDFIEDFFFCLCVSGATIDSLFIDTPIIQIIIINYLYVKTNREQIFYLNLRILVPIEGISVQFLRPL